MPQPRRAPGGRGRRRTTARARRASGRRARGRHAAVPAPRRRHVTAIEHHLRFVVPAQRRDRHQRPAPPGTSVKASPIATSAPRGCATGSPVLDTNPLDGQHEQDDARAERQTRGLQGRPHAAHRTTPGPPGLLDHVGEHRQREELHPGIRDTADREGEDRQPGPSEREGRHLHHAGERRRARRTRGMPSACHALRHTASSTGMTTSAGATTAAKRTLTERLGAEEVGRDVLRRGEDDAGGQRLEDEDDEQCAEARQLADGVQPRPQGGRPRRRRAVRLSCPRRLATVASMPSDRTTAETTAMTR